MTAVCSKCFGGGVIGDATCPQCGGTGAEHTGTASGQSMLRVKARFLGDHPTPGLRNGWRKRRAESMASWLARYRLALRRNPGGRRQIKRMILHDMVPDCGWPTGKWLKWATRRAMRELEMLQ